MGRFDVGFRVNGKGTAESRVDANSEYEAEQKVIKKYNQPIEILYVRRVK